MDTILENLPPTDTKRWVVRKKAAVIAAVRSGAISLEEVCARYELTLEEFNSWQRNFEAHGIAGLQATHVKMKGAGLQ